MNALLLYNALDHLEVGRNALRYLDKHREQLPIHRLGALELAKWRISAAMAIVDVLRAEARLEQGAGRNLELEQQPSLDLGRNP